MGAVIIDDGWQTDDNQRGYDFTGDWQVATTRFPDLTAHVARTKERGLAELLWISLPFVGRRSESVATDDHLVLPDDGGEARLWDVRLPEARRHVAGICRRLVHDHGLAGLKIDFIDQWSACPPTDAPAAADTHDYTVGVDRLLQAIVDDLRSVSDEPLVEFRQRYVGPRMMRYGNLLRVADCPTDAYTNRLGSIDVSHLLTAGDAVVPVGERRTVIANATGGPTLVVELASPAGLSDVKDCLGVDRPDLALDLRSGLHRISLPRGGTAVLTSRGERQRMV